MEFRGFSNSSLKVSSALNCVQSTGNSPVNESLCSESLKMCSVNNMKPLQSSSTGTERNSAIISRG